MTYMETKLRQNIKKVEKRIKKYELFIKVEQKKLKIRKTALDYYLKNREVSFAELYKRFGVQRE